MDKPPLGPIPLTEIRSLKKLSSSLVKNPNKLNELSITVIIMPHYLYIFSGMMG
jgi:hypothetical protein